ncbi:MAG: zinc-binding dehydrogenase [Dehalococcoidia bacterium]
MKAVAWSDPHSLSIEDRPEPSASPGQLVVRMTSVGICGTDLHLYKGEFQARKGVVAGHEIAGVVVSGDGLAAGTAVAVDPMLSCLHCASCREGQSSVCQASTLMGISADGGMQEYLAAPAANCYPLPPGIDPQLGSLAEPAAVAIRGIQRAEIPMGARVLVLGAGPIGLMCAMLLRDRAGEVAITARYAHQAAAALALGASAAFEPGSDDLKRWSRARRPDVVVETVGGTADTLAEAFRVVRPGGTIVAIGVFTGHTQINGFKLVNEEIKLVGSVMYGRAGSTSEYGVAASLLGRYASDLPRFQTAVFPLARAREGFEAAVDKTTGNLKVALVP